MTALLENSDTIVPTPKDIALATESSRVLSAAGLANAKADFKVRLDNGAELTLPNAAMRLISHLLTEMSHGNAVTLIPIHANLTTQEAADYLGVSRPHLIGPARGKQQGRPAWPVQPHRPAADRPRGRPARQTAP
ncbi:MAG: helix-turn-helix domain-containing protein [Proteobacteria bacterium]|nr:helix-turn-helix domain-containing protein [Pseudomonadota bacterium]